jgi:translin
VDLTALSAEFQRQFDEKMRAREAALAASRRAIRTSANAIRAIHRGEADEAARLMEEAHRFLEEGESAVTDHPDIRYAGFLHDAQKEYAEARLTDAVVTGRDIPEPDELRVTVAAYLNGMAETIGECRRAVLDGLRGGDFDEAERLLGRMDDLYSVLVTMDYPDALTGNLRRSTDVARSIIEKTRGDLTVSLVQQDLRKTLERYAKYLRRRA